MAVHFRSDRGRWRADVSTPTGRLTRLFATEAEARAWERSTRAELQAGEDVGPLPEPSPPGSIRSVVRVCQRLDWHGKDGSQLRNAERLAELLGADRPIAAIREQEIDALVATLRSRGNANGTINRYLSALLVLLKRGQRLGLIQALPLMPERRLLREAEPRDLVLPAEWLLALVDRLERRECRDAVALTLFLRRMGCRVGEALALEWDRVDRARNRITFTETKGNQARCLPIPESVLPLLDTAAARGGARPFAMKYDTFLAQYKEAKDHACDVLGLGDAVRQQWVIHTLRHTMLTELAQRGWGAPAIAQWAGHKSLSVTQRYVHGSAIDLEQLMKC